ncbi:MAG: autotransporter outer membrane beta-barrel domain-containing protein, partial [Planctomycetes bacterium]|nr:autotransporter outer membrane beta-barrel domain-containing protein [Planctomycetota bacterium]
AESPDPIRIIHGRHFADDTLFNLISNGIGLTIRQEILADGYYLYLGKTAPDFVDLLQGYGTPNARRAAEAMTEIVARGDGHLVGELYGFIAALPDDPVLIADAFQQVHGEVFAAGQDAVLRMERSQRDASRRARRAAVEARRSCTGLVAPGWLNDAVAWTTATGSWSDRRHDQGYSGHDLATGGFAMGLDKAIRDAWFLGVGLGYDRGRQRFDTITSRDDIESFRANLYGGYTSHGWDVDAHLGYSRNRHKTTRTILLQSDLTAFAASPNARYHVDLLSAGIAVGRDLEWNDWRIRPSAALDYAHLWTSSIQERGSSLAELGADRSTAHVLDATVGVSAGREFHLNNVTLRPEVRADYTRHLGDNRASVSTHFLSVPDIPFIAESGRWSRNTVRLGTALEARWRNCVTVRAEYDFHLGERFTGHQVSVGVGIAW